MSKIAVMFDNGEFEVPNGVRILLVGANASRRIALSRILRLAGADVYTARTHDEALHELLSQKYWAVVTDAEIGFDWETPIFHYWDKLPESHRPTRIISISIEHGPWVECGPVGQRVPAGLDVESLLGALAGKMN